ncbi:MAG: 3-hydroxybutyryl-CoA dehydrogenase [Planctomycetota bacterium]|nr:3-hydroxybutyryl-CoA dehydrogenase [Planctomycetota bacterium]
MEAGLVGAGTMGSGIALAFAIHEEYRVTLCDIDEHLAEDGKRRISAKLDRLARKGKVTADTAAAVVARISTGALESLAPCELVVEAASEDMRVKRELFAALQKVCGVDCIFATNTSSLSITEMGQDLGRGLIGMHFFNPADVMALVEVVAGADTAPETVARVKDIALSIGKTPVEVKESGGFVVNRLLIPMINEAVGIYAEGLASVDDIDTAMRLGANHPMGPLALGDLIGLDVCLAIMEVLHAEFGDDKYRPHPLLRKMVRGKSLGRKTGKGFFPYTT